MVESALSWSFLKRRGEEEGIGEEKEEIAQRTIAWPGAGRKGPVYSWRQQKERTRKFKPDTGSRAPENLKCNVHHLRRGNSV